MLAKKYLFQKKNALMIRVVKIDRHYYLIINNQLE